MDSFVLSVLSTPDALDVSGLWESNKPNSMKTPDYAQTAMKIKTKTKKLRCGKCKKTNGIIKFYLFPGDKKVRTYHSACKKSLKVNRKKK